MLTRKSAINIFAINLLLLLGFSLIGFVVMGYHPGLEDDGHYLPAIKSDVNPALYPYDAQFFRVEFQATVFDKWVAGFVRFTGIPVAETTLLWQFGSIVLTIFACWRIARRLFPETHAQWAGVALVAAMFTLPVTGTALFLLDQHLHARNVATALILLAVSWILGGWRWQATPLLVLAFLIHPIMAAFGFSFCFFLIIALSDSAHTWFRSWRTAVHASSLTAFVPLGWIFEPPTPLWRKALNTRPYLFLNRWHWYEWLGAIGPLLLFGLLWRLARKRGETVLARFAIAVCVYGVFQQAVAMIVLGVPSLVRLTPLQPMRYLQLVYFFLALVAGCLFGKYLLKATFWRWTLFLVLVNGSMFASQRIEFPSSNHIEWPGRSPSNPWIQAFEWIRSNTPTNAYFALDPRYLEAPGEDFHSFRALAERSQLADEIKDTAVVTQVPELGPEWDREVEAQRGWKNFQLEDFRRLKANFGVGWVLVRNPQPAGLDCAWHNRELSVCRIP